MSDRPPASLPPAATLVGDLARSAPSADNTQPWRFEWDGSSFLIRSGRTPTEDAVPFGPNGHATRLAIGALWENVATLASRAGWADPQAGLPTTTGDSSLTVTVGAPPRALDGIAADVLQRHTNRFPYARASIPTAIVDQLVEARERSARLVWIDDRAIRKPLSDAFRDCAEARFRTQALHEWLFGSLRFTPSEVARDDGLDVATLHLPPGGAQFMRFISPWNRAKQLNRLGLYKMMASTEVRTLENAAALVAVVANSNPAATIDAGRLMQRTWIRLNANGVAVHPQYVITDQLTRLRESRVPPECVEAVGRVAQSIPQLMGLGPDESLHMLLRVGIPRRRAPRSRRHTLGSLLARSY